MESSRVGKIFDGDGSISGGVTVISGLDWPGEWQLSAGLGLGVEPEVSEKAKERRLHSATPQPPFSKTSSGKVD